MRSGEPNSRDRFGADTPWDLRVDAADGSPGRPGRTGVPWPGLAIAAFLGVLVVVGSLYVRNAATSGTPWLNHDVAYHTYLGEEMHRGLRLYVDLQEDNPPGSPLLLGFVLRAGETLGLPDFSAHHLLVLLLGVAGLATIRRALPDPEDDATFAAVALAYLLVVVRGTFSNNLFPGAAGLPYDFGQREHLFSIFFLPYLLLRLRRRPVTVGLYPWLLGLGFVTLFKPHWPLLVALVESNRILDRDRDWKVPVVLGCGMILPFVMLAAHSLDSVVAFFGVNVPAFLRGAYAHYDNDFGEFARSPLHLQMIVGGVFLACMAAWTWFARQVTLRSLGVLVGVAALTYWSMIDQHKFWSYHTMTYFAATIVPGALLFGVAVSNLRDRARTPLVALGLAAGLVASILTVGGTARMLTSYPPLGAYLVPLIQPHERVLYFSTSVSTSYAPLLLRRPMVGPWTVHVELQELLGTPRLPGRDRALAEYGRSVSSLIEEDRPGLLVFSPERQALPGNRNLHDIFVALGVVPLEGYREVSRSRLQRIAPQLGFGWTVYERVPDSGRSPGR